MQNRLLPIGQAAKLLDISIDTLRRWDKSGRFKAVRKTPGGDRYYKKEDIELRVDLFQKAKKWASGVEAEKPNENYYCQTKDVFKGRLDKLLNTLGEISGLQNIHPLIIAIAGEIGFNSFDHNFGNWPDIMGTFFACDPEKRKIILADRGQGIFATLKRVRPEIKDDAEALKIAFTEIISGREPEARGNGLKFVKETVFSNNLELFFQSGNAELILKKGSQNLKIKTIKIAIRGCLAQIKF